MKSEGTLTNKVHTRGGKMSTKWAKMLGLVPFIVHIGSVEVKMQLLPDNSGRGGGGMRIITGSPDRVPVEVMGEIGKPAVSGVVVAIVVAQQFGVEETFGNLSEGKVALLR